MINSEVLDTSYVIQGGVTTYPIGFEYHFNEQNSPQLLVKIGDDAATINVDFKLSTDNSEIILIPTEEEAKNQTSPNDTRWMERINGKELYITRNIPFKQTSDYTVGRISPEQIEYDFDRTVMRDQEILRVVKEFGVDVALAESLSNAAVETANEAVTAANAAIDSANNAVAIATETVSVASEAKEISEQASRDAIDAMAESSNAVKIAEDAKTDTQAAVSEAQAAAFAAQQAADSVENKQDKLTAGTGIKIEDNVISTTDAYSKTEIDNKVSVINADIDANAEAIQKTREDYIEADSEIHQILNSQASELTTLRGNQASLGNQVAGIEEKIPGTASGTNPLITKQQLLDEEMDIREDLNQGLSDVQTQVTAQAAAIANKQDTLIAGDNITIVDNVISSTGGGSAGEGGGLDKAYTKLMVHVPTKEEFDSWEVQQGALGYTFALPDGLEDGEYYFYITVLDRPRIPSTDEWPNESAPINNYKDFIVDFAMANGRVRFCSVRCGERAWYNVLEWGRDGGLDSDIQCFDIYTCNGRQVFFNRNRFVEGGLFEYDGWDGRTDTDVAAVTFSKVVNRNTKEQFAIENDEYMHYFHGNDWKYPWEFGWTEEGNYYRARSIAPQSGLKDYILQDLSSSLSPLINLYTPADYGGYMIGIGNLLRDNNSFDINIGDKIKLWINNAYSPESWVVFEIDVLNKTYTKKTINGGIDGVNDFKVGIASNDWRRQVVFYKGDVSEIIGFGEHQVYYQVQPNFFVNNLYFDFWWEEEYANYNVTTFDVSTPVTPTDLAGVYHEITQVWQELGNISNVLDTINGEDI